MTSDQLKDLFEQVRDGRISPDDALDRIGHMPFEDLGFAKVDHHRTLRHGMPEVILGRGKSSAEVRGIAEKLLERSPNLLVTRADDHMASTIKEIAPTAEFFPRSGAIRVWGDRTILGKSKIAVVCAGTSDIPVAEEARLTCRDDGRPHDVPGLRRGRGRHPSPDRPSRTTCETCAGSWSVVRRHGGRAAQRGGRAWWTRARSSPCPPASATARPSAASPALLGMLNSCSPPAPPSSTSTTASAPPTWRR